MEMDEVFLDDDLDGGFHFAKVIRVRRPVDAVVVGSRVGLREGALPGEAREAFADVDLGFFQGIDRGVAGDYGVA